MSNFLNIFCNSENSLRHLLLGQKPLFIYSNSLTSYLQSTLLFVFIFLAFNKCYFQVVS